MSTDTLRHLPAFRSFGTDNPQLTAALATLDGYDPANTAAETLADAKAGAAAALMAAAQGRLGLVRDLTLKLKGGEQPPADVSRALAKADAAITQARSVVTVLGEIDSDLARERDETMRGAAPGLMAFLDSRLQAALAEARALDLGDVDNAQAAIDADRVDQWQTTIRLLAVYRQIRQAQQQVQLQLESGSPGTQHRLTFGVVKNYAETFPGWHDRDRQVVLGTVNGEPVYVTAPWEVEEPASLWQYAVQHPAVELWVATAHQADEEYRAALTEARHVQNLVEREQQNASLTPDERKRLATHHMYQQQYNL